MPLRKDQEEVDHGTFGVDLLVQLECILQHDTSIDEIGFVHPTQLEELKTDALCNIFIKEKIETTLLQYDELAFWYSNHKLAISTHVLSQLYRAALQAFFDADRRYKQLINVQRRINESTDVPLAAPHAEIGPNSEGIVGNEVLRHTKALLIISPDFNTAWNSRKLLKSRNIDCVSFTGELHLSELILSYSPKSESAWTHRRWVIKTMTREHHNLEDVIEKESTLVKKIGEKTRMNYRAWNHRCWLVSYMSRTQILEELNNSRRWANLHVADNSCFHFHRRLMLKMMEGIFPENQSQVCSNQALDFYLTWKEELDWDHSLIEKYIGREALWVHRRFLLQCWLMHFTGDQHEQFHLESQRRVTFDSVEIIDLEMQLVRSCLHASKGEFEEANVQAEHAVLHLLWIWKQALRLPCPKIREKMRMEDIQSVLQKFCPEKSFLWDAFAC